MLRREKIIIEIPVESNNQIYTKNFDLPKNVKAVLGLLVSTDKDDMLYHRGKQKIEINKVEFFPEKYRSKLLMAGLNVPMNAKYYDMGRFHPGNGAVKIVYTDRDDGRSVFEPYLVEVYLDVEIEGGQ